MPRIISWSSTGLPIYAREPGRDAQLSPDELSAIEPSNDPRSLRLYTRPRLDADWSIPAILSVARAPEWYKVRHDTSD